MEKKIRPYHYSLDSPKEAIQEIFNRATDLESLLYELDLWFPIAVVNKSGTYTDAEQREQLVLFLQDFRQLIEVMSKENFFDNKAAMSLSKDFADKYDIEYIRIELFDLFFAVVTYDGTIKVNKFTSGDFYFFFLTIAESTHQFKLYKYLK